ncbi:MAG: hypothetical protein U0637_08635 [Phycisphaerales bacterium]
MAVSFLTVLLFPAYAVLIWYLCVRFRRQVWGFVSLAFGLTFVATLATLQHRLRASFDLDGFVFTHLDFLLWVEFAAIGLVGIFLLCLPTHAAASPCRACGYELDGLEHDNPMCPECGLRFAARKPRRMRCGICGVRSEMDPERPRCVHCDGPDEIPAAASR